MGNRSICSNTPNAIAKNVTWLLLLLTLFRRNNNDGSPIEKGYKLSSRFAPAPGLQRVISVSSRPYIHAIHETTFNHYFIR
jgi:hypothetical protein